MGCWEFEDSEKTTEKEIGRQSITIDTPGFEKLTTALNYTVTNLQSSLSY